MDGFVLLGSDFLGKMMVVRLVIELVVEEIVLVLWS